MLLNFDRALVGSSSMLPRTCVHQLIKRAWHGMAFDKQFFSTTSLQRRCSFHTFYWIVGSLVSFSSRYPHRWKVLSLPNICLYHLSHSVHVNGWGGNAWFRFQNQDVKSIYTDLVSVASTHFVRWILTWLVINDYYTRLFSHVDLTHLWTNWFLFCLLQYNNQPL